MNNLKIMICAILVTLICFTSCKDEPKNYATFSGKVENLSSDIDSVIVFIPNGYRKTITLNNDGTFKDTLNVKEGKYKFQIGDEYGTIYLKNSENLHLTTDYKDFDNKLSFSGDGSILEKTQAETKLLHLVLSSFNDEILDMDSATFEKSKNGFNDKYAQLKNEYKNLDASFWKESDENVNIQLQDIEDYRKTSFAIKEKFTGVTSPTFAMESIDGNIVHLNDFKGKYVYVDVWATWCGPCKREIPSLKKIEEAYKDKNLVVVSMSVDALKDRKKWEKFVKEEDLQGVQVFAENSWKSEFVTAFEIKSIPRFILIGPDAKVVSPDAPRPSSPKLIELFDSLNI